MPSPSGLRSSTFTLRSIISALQGPFRAPTTEAYSTTLSPGLQGLHDKRVDALDVSKPGLSRSGPLWIFVEQLGSGYSTKRFHRMRCFVQKGSRSVSVTDCAALLKSAVVETPYQWSRAYRLRSRAIVSAPMVRSRRARAQEPAV